jgi:hypothetical protein
MLELRPACEHCAAALPPASPDARICSFECTFCAHCADTLLQQVCPNCSGNLVPRPIRPAEDWSGGGNSLHQHPAVSPAKVRPADLAAHAELLRRLAGRPPEAR